MRTVLFICWTGRRCEPLPPPQNAQCDADVSNVKTGTVVTCNCTDDSFLFFNGLTSWSFVCNDRGVWLQPNLDCLGVCGALPIVENVIVDVTAVDNRVGGLATVTCVRGTRFENGDTTKELVCLEDGTWDGVAPCLRMNLIFCVKLYFIDYTNVLLFRRVL